MPQDAPVDHVPFETARLLARACRLDDAATLSGLMTADISRWVATWPFPLSEAEAAASLSDSIAAAERGDAVPTAIVERCSGRVIGWLKLSLADREARVFELSYWIAEPFQRRGYAFEIAQAAIRFAFSDCGAGCVEAGAQVDNQASHALLAKLGMQRCDDRSVWAPSRQRKELCGFWRIENPLTD